MWRRVKLDTRSEDLLVSLLKGSHLALTGVTKSLQPHHPTDGHSTDGTHSTPTGCSLGRNVNFYDASKPSGALGGPIQNGSVTETNLLDMMGILSSRGGDCYTRPRKGLGPCRSGNEQPAATRRVTMVFIATVGAPRVGDPATRRL